MWSLALTFRLLHWRNTSRARGSTASNARQVQQFRARTGVGSEIAALAKAYARAIIPA